MIESNILKAMKLWVSKFYDSRKANGFLIAKIKAYLLYFNENGKVFLRIKNVTNRSNEAFHEGYLEVFMVYIRVHSICS